MWGKKDDGAKEGIKIEIIIKKIHQKKNQSAICDHIVLIKIKQKHKPSKV